MAERTNMAAADATARTVPDISGATVRDACQHDLGAVERLLTAAELPLDGVAGAIETFIVAESTSGDSSGALIGVAGLEIRDDVALLRSVAVAPAWRTRGLGRVLVEHALAAAQARGIRALYLLTTTAEHYFPRFGFGVVDRAVVPAPLRATREFQGACPASAVVMARVLNDQSPSAPASA